MSSRTKVVTIALLVVVVALLIAQVLGLGALDASIDVPTLALLLLVMILSFALAAPKRVGEALERITTFKLSGLLEGGLQAANRAERIQAQLPAALHDVETEPRPRGGGQQQEYEVVRERLQERVRFIQEGLF